MEQDRMKEILEDVNACASDALEAIAIGKTDELRMLLKAITDVCREAIEEMENE